MQKSKLKLSFNGELLFENAKWAKSFKEKLIGLMFQKKTVKFDAIIFKNAFWIHSFFVFFKFNALFLDKDLKVIKIRRNIRPFSLLKPVFGAKYVVEYFCDLKVGLKDEITIEESI